MLPAVAQGALGVEIREDDTQARELLAPIDDRDTRICVTAERACLAGLDGSCRTPIAGLAELEGDRLSLRALTALPDGSIVHRAAQRGPADAPESLGAAVAATLLQAAEPAFLRALA
jgi:hydroxymethylbilane synthase